MNLLVSLNVQCPHCWEPVTIEVDTTQGSYETVEDCSVCCIPMTLRIVCHSGEVTSIVASP
ncbi:MAG: CPXCG motif-containing cysteine-rich protein [Verrucomicrobiae bacterium]